MVPPPPEAQEASLRRDVATLREKWETLNKELSKRSTQLKVRIYTFISIAQSIDIKCILNENYSV